MSSNCNVTYRDLGSILRVCQINVEGISKSKSQFLEKLLDDHKIDVLVVQETHAECEDDLHARGSVSGYTVIGATYSKAYGIATYVRNQLSNISLLSTSTNDDINIVTIKVADTIVNIYKPPSVAWPDHVLETHPHPVVYIGDLNSHHELWKYETSDANGDRLVEWCELHHNHLVFDAKDFGTFFSAAWRREYNPDLCFVSTNTDQQLNNPFSHIVKYCHTFQEVNIAQ